MSYSLACLASLVTDRTSRHNYRTTSIHPEPMKFRGLFIGIDRYASPMVRDLSCSARDAKTLYALFADTLDAGECVLLTDAEATRDRILAELDRLKASAPDDLVFIHFSGHGSDTHHLVTHDCDPLSLDSTCVLLHELEQRFAAIPARNVILCLDCCFSGGAGAKVFHSPLASRDPASSETLLQAIGGTGRVILTASAADQEAIEDRRTGHGIFSYYLIQGLRGAPEVIDAGTIPFLSLAHFVIQSVEAAATRVRHVQRPALRSLIDGDVRLPLLAPSANFSRLFPDKASAPVTADLSSLIPHGFPVQFVSAIQGAIPSLNELQLSAINDMRLFDGDHLVVSAPTSSGKTMIGELAALQAHLRGERTYVLLPLRALVNDKYEDLKSKYGPLGLRVIRSTGEIADDNDALMRGKFDIALLTYERFAALSVVAPFILRNVGLIVVDEVQMITDEGRGANLEFLLTYLKSQRVVGIEPQLVALSAVIGHTNGFERWLGARLLLSTRRPIPLEEGVLNMAGEFHYRDVDGVEQRVMRYVTPEYRKGSSQDVIIPLVRQLVAAGEKVIVFRETKPVVRATAQYLAANLQLPIAAKVLSRLPGGDPSAASAALRTCVTGGVAFHSADLDREEREVVEASFRDSTGEIKVLVATTTLAMGVNTPAWSVVIEGLEHPQSVPYTVAEYKNMVGRAGRLGWSPKGKAFLIASGHSEEYRLWNSYVNGNPEALRSRFGSQSLLVGVCRVLGTAAASKVPGLTETEVIEFLQSTFAAFQSGKTWSGVEIQNAVHRLTGAGLVEKVDDRLKLTPLGEIAGQLGTSVESVVQVAAALRGVPISSLGLHTLIAATQVTTELDDVYLPMHKKSIQERARWQAVLGQQRLPAGLSAAIRNGQDPIVTARCKRLAAALMWVQGVDLDKIEESLLQHMPDNNAAGPIRSVAERTRDLIGIVARVAEILNPGSDEDAIRLGRLVDSASLQLELGIPGEVTWLAQFTKRTLTRGDYLALVRHGWTSRDALRQVDEPALKGILGSSLKAQIVMDALLLPIEDPKPFGAVPAMPKPPEQ